MRDLWACNDTDIVVGYVGRVALEKNCVAIARAVRGLGRRGLGVLYGTRTAQAESILAEIQRIAGDQIRVFNATEDVGSVLHAIDVFMLPSYAEGLSLGLLEAWTAGVPVVATRVGALPDLEARFGQLAVSVLPEATEKTLRQAVTEAVFGPRKDAIVRRAQTMVMTHFNAAKMARDWTAYLSSLTDVGVLRKERIV